MDIYTSKASQKRITKWRMVMVLSACVPNVHIYFQGWEDRWDTTLRLSAAHRGGLLRCLEKAAAKGVVHVARPLLYVHTHHQALSLVALFVSFSVLVCHCFVSSS